MAKNHSLSSKLLNFESFKKMAYVMIHTALIENKQTDIYVKIEITHGQLIYKLLPFEIPKKYVNLITFHIEKDNYKMLFRQMKLKNSYDENRYIKNNKDIIVNVSYTALLHYLTVILYNNDYMEITDSNKHPYIIKQMSGYGRSLDYRKGIMNSLIYLIDNNQLFIE
jgi:hypothetical protein